MARVRVSGEAPAWCRDGTNDEETRGAERFDTGPRPKQNTKRGARIGAPFSCRARTVPRGAPAKAAPAARPGRYHADCFARDASMQDKSNRRLLDVDIPAQPDVLVKLSLLLAEDEVDLNAASLLISSDMALAAAVLKAVNSAMYGLRGRVQSVQQAITYLGTREVASVTFEMGLRAVFPDAPELEPIWERASVRGLLMGRIGQALNVDPWAAHSAGLFEECGKAVLFRHAPDRYRPLLTTAKDDEELLFLEHQEFGVSHDALGAALCESWGLAPAAVHSVRYHVIVNTTRELPMQVQRRAI